MNHMMVRVFVLLIFSMLIISCRNKENPEEKGLWRLYTMEKQNENGVWETWNGGMQGNLLYDGSGHMALHLSTKDFEKIDFEYPNFSDTISERALKHQTNTYFYMGEYIIDHQRGIVKHHRISHSNPKDWNVEVERRFSFSNDTLIIVPVEAANSGLKLKWLKVAN